MEMTAAGNLPAVLDDKPCRVRPQTLELGLWGMVLFLLPLVL